MRSPFRFTVLFTGEICPDQAALICCYRQDRGQQFTKSHIQIQILPVSFKTFHKLWQATGASDLNVFIIRSGWTFGDSEANTELWKENSYFWAFNKCKLQLQYSCMIQTVQICSKKMQKRHPNDFQVRTWRPQPVAPQFCLYEEFHPGWH